MRILVVEDERDLRLLLANALRDEGYSVDEAVDGDEALAKTSIWDYDAVILDLMLPKRSGWEVLSHVRQQRTTPVLILTARDATSDRVQGLDQGADDYIVKPFEIRELLARLRAVIRRAAGQPHSVVEVRGIAIDTATRTVIRDGRPVALTAREYALVEYLAIHRGKLVTRGMLYDHLFDETDDSLSNLVEVHICNLRKKLGKDFITTRRGQGYIVDA